jgi:hypothetical protein
MNKTNPIKGRKASKPSFKKGVLCYVVLRKYQGKGRPVLIMHEAKSDHYGYGAFNTWIARPSGVRKIS